MDFRLPGLLFAVAVSFTGCGGDSTTTLDALNTRTITLPGGQRIQAEVVSRQEDIMRGMMFRDSLAPDRGMLFIHVQPGAYTYWMYQVRIPLDILWMSTDRRIVEISPDTPPCQTAASQCPTYGGHNTARYVLELAGGMAKKYGLRTGDQLEF
jgi:uncharacterized membrane protein (UPF0127 family)